MHTNHIDKSKAVNYMMFYHMLFHMVNHKCSVGYSSCPLISLGVRSYRFETQQLLFGDFPSNSIS